MKETNFGQQYFAIFGAVKDNISEDLVTLSQKDGIDKNTIQKVILVAQNAVDRTADNAYGSFWNSVKKFFRQD